MEPVATSLEVAFPTLAACDHVAAAGPFLSDEFETAKDAFS